MSEILFYAAPRAGLRALLPRLLQACLEHQWRALVQTASPQQSAAWDEWLWTYAPNSFLPHGRADAKHAADQPICISHDEAAPNGAQVLFLLDGSARANADRFQRCVYVFEDAGADSPLRARMEAAWRQHHAAGAAPVWWQRVRGRWQQSPPVSAAAPSSSDAGGKKA